MSLRKRNYTFTWSNELSLFLGRRYAKRRGNQITGGVAGNRAGLKVTLSDNGEVIGIGSRYYSTDSDQEVGRARGFQYEILRTIYGSRMDKELVTQQKIIMGVLLLLPQMVFTVR